MELGAGGELFDRIVECGRMPEDEARSWFRQLMNGIEHFHSVDVCHRDLKPQNILIDGEGNLKITDFGLAGVCGKAAEHLAAQPCSELLETTCGTPNYVAPEVLMDQPYNGKAADLWSAGVILYVLLAGFLPFDEQRMVDLFRKILKAVLSLFPSPPLVPLFFRDN